MGALIITTGTEADTLAIKEVAERFGCQVSLRFGSYYFCDNVIGNGKVMSATGEIEAEQDEHKTATKNYAEILERNRSLRRHTKKPRR